MSLLVLDETCNLKDHPNWKHCPFKECKLGNLTDCPNGYIIDHSIKDAYSAVERVVFKN